MSVNRYNYTEKIWEICSPQQFEELALWLFQDQYKSVDVYRRYCQNIGIEDTRQVSYLRDIPFLPIDLFKTHTVLRESDAPQQIFLSSGITHGQRSQHSVVDIGLYKESFVRGFENQYGEIDQYHILALLPSYQEQKQSSLIYMVDHLMKLNKDKESCYYLEQSEKLLLDLQRLEAQGEKILLIGVSYALIDFVTQYPCQLSNVIVMETGGMKGRREEMIREALHEVLKKGFGVSHIHSEYGMCELLSQCYSKRDGLFKTPRWMKIVLRDTEDPLTIFDDGDKTGGINVIDLANRDSCAFVATQDIGRYHSNDTFEILGRFDYSEIRGCNLLID